MTVKKLILIGSISVAAIAAAIIIPISIVNANQNKGHREPTEGDIVDDDKLGPEMQEKLDGVYDAYRTAALSSQDIILKEIDFVYVSETNGLSYSTDAEKLYAYSLNSGVWEVYSSTKISLTPVVEPEQQFNGYYVYYKA